jgi:hypothetical protein
MRGHVRDAEVLIAEVGKPGVAQLVQGLPPEWR